MKTPAQANLVEAVQAVPDPRRQCKNLRHRLVDVVILGFAGIRGGCDDFVEIEAFARAKEDLFRRFLELPPGIPSHDTFRRVFQAIGPLALQRCLIAWLQGLRPPGPAPSSPLMARRCGAPVITPKAWGPCTSSAPGRAPTA